MTSHEPIPEQESEDPEAIVGRLEHQLRSEPAPSDEEKTRLRTLLSTLYLDKLGDPLSAAVHVEELLLGDSLEEAVLELATALLGCRPIAPRIAEKLSTAYARLAQPENEAAALRVELTLAKPERLPSVQRRLAELAVEKPGDAGGALGLLEPLVRMNPEDGVLLSRFVDAAVAAEKIEAGMAVLTEVRGSAPTPLGRARVAHALGSLALQEGELPGARQAFLSAVLEKVIDDAVLASARRLVALSREPEDPAVLGPALEVLVTQEPDVAERHSAAERLLGLAAEGSPQAVACWQALLDSPRSDEAIGHLERIYEKTGNDSGLGAVLRVRSLRVTDTAEAASLAYRSASLRSASGASNDDAIEAWKFVLERFGPSREIHEKLLPLLEKEGRWEELCDRLEAELYLSSPIEAAAELAKVGQIRLSRLNQEEKALGAFERSLEMDPSNAVSRLCLERLTLEGTHRLRAAELLEAASVVAGSEEGILSALETRAELAATPDEGLTLFARAVDLTERAQERATRGLVLSGQALALAAAHRPSLVPPWIERTHRLAERADDRAMEADILLEASRAATGDRKELAGLACEAVDALMPLGRSSEALTLALRAFEAFPGSLSLSKRVDRLTEGREPPEARLARYERTLDLLPDAEERIELRHAMAAIARDDLEDLPAAAAHYRAILAEQPGEERAQRALVEAYQKTGDDALLPSDFTNVVAGLDPTSRSAILSGKIRSLIARGDRDAALEACRTLLATPEASDAAVETVASVAYEENEQELYREALERLTGSTDPNVRVLALERLGHFFEQLGDRRAAAESWKPAALLSAGDKAGDEHARDLYERVLAAAPDDCEAAERLLGLYVQEGRWVNVPGIYAILLRASASPEETANTLLALESRAKVAGAADEFVGMLDETLPYLGSASEEARRRLMEAKARVLAAAPGRSADAAMAYRALIEAFGKTESVAAFEAFIERRLRPDDRQAERRWIFEWRSTHHALPAETLLAWGQSEEAYGDPSAAIRAYERATEADSTRVEAFQALVRLKKTQADYDGALAAMRAVRERSTGDEKAKIELEMALLLGEEIGRPEEALVSVAPLLSSSPPPAPAVEIAKRALERQEDLDRSVELIERASLETADPLTAATNLELLLGAPLDETSLGERRESWVVRLAELRQADPEAALRVLANGLSRSPSSTALWDAFIARAGSVKRADVVFEAFVAAIEHPGADNDLVERLGKRTIAFYDEWSSDSAEVQKTLEAVLERVPSARWALDRVKLLLFGSERWQELFRIYDRAIDGARDRAERSELLDEAALAARDLARDADRAIGYLEQLRAERPSDAPVTASLERLYERQGESAKLIALLSERQATATGLGKEELEQKIASLWLDLGDVGSAHGLVETMLGTGTALRDVAGLLERILATVPERDAFESPQSPHSRAVALLAQHHGSEGRIADVIRVREAELAFAQSAPHRTKVVETLVTLHLEAGGDRDDAFPGVIPKVQAFAEQGPLLGRAAAAKLLGLSEEAWKRRGASADSGAAQAAYWSVRRLEAASLEPGAEDTAAGILLDASRLPFEDERRRTLIRDAAIHLADGGQAERAALLLSELFAEDPTDAVVAPTVERLARLLEDTAGVAQRAKVWESFGEAAIRLGSSPHARRYLTMAAELWEAARKIPRAIGAYRTSASLGDQEALSALARLHRGRGEFRDAAEALEWAFVRADAGAKVSLGTLLADDYLALGAREQAEERLEEVLRVVPAEKTVRERLAALYREDGAFRPLGELLVRGASVTTSPEERLPLLREAAEVFASRLEEPTRAIPLLETAISLPGADADLPLFLADVLHGAGRYRDAVRVLQGKLALFGELRPKARAPIHYRLAQALFQLSNGREALAELRVAVEIDPSNVVMLYELGRRALEQNNLDLAESTYRALLLSLHRSTPGEGPSRVDVYLDLSEVAARRNDHARAAEYIESSFDVSLEGLEEALRLEKSLGERGRDDLVARSVERRLRAAKDPGAAAAALAELLKLQRAGAGNVAELPAIILRHAAEIGKRVEQTGNTDRDVWVSLADAASVGGGDVARTELLSRRVELLLKKAESDDGQEARDEMRDAAASCERDLADPKRARLLYEGLLDRFPTDWASWEAVFRLATPAEDAERLGALVKHALAEVESIEDRSRLRLELARLLFTEPGQTELAIRTLEELIDEDGEQPAALELLAGALERQGDDVKLVDLLETRLRAAQKSKDAAELVAISLRLGAALERRGDARRATGVYDALVADESVDARLLGGVRDRLEALSSPSLANCLERMLKDDRGPEAAAMSKRLVALRDESRDHEGALRAAVLGFELDPADAALRERVVRDYEDHGKIDDARRVLGRAVEAAPDDRPLFLSWIDASLRAGDQAGAIAALDRSLDVTPADTELLRERARAKQAAGRDEDALGDLERAYALDPSFAFDVRTVLERLVERDGPDHERHVLALVDVLIEQEESGDAEKLLRRFLDARPEHVGGLERLAALRAADQDWPAAVAAYERLLPLVGGDHDRFARLSLAFAEACDRAGGSAHARAALERAYEHAPDRADLRERLEAIYEAEGDRARLSALLMTGAERATEPATKASLYFRAAELLLGDAGGAGRALEAASAGRALDAGSLEGALLYARALRALDRDEEALAELLSLPDRTRGKSTLVLSRVHLEIARIYLDADYLHEGLDALKIAFQLDPRSVDAAYQLGLTAVDLGDDATASRALRTVTATRDEKVTRETKAMAFYHLARLAQWKGDKRRAQTMAKSALSENPDCDVAKALLEALGR